MPVLAGDCIWERNSSRLRCRCADMEAEFPDQYPGGDDPLHDPYADALSLSGS